MNLGCLMMNGMVNKMKKETKKIKNYKVNTNKVNSKKNIKCDVDDNKSYFNKLDKNKILFYVITFFVIAFICFLFPSSHDYWAWGSVYGIERLQSNFKDYNGRWFGNFVVLLLTRSNFLKTLVMSFCLVLLLYFVNELSKNKKLNCWLSLLLLSALPQLILRQAVVWTSGFANYVVSIVLILVYVFYNRNLFENKYKEYSKLSSILFLILGFSTALFVEHVTLYILFLGLFILLYKYIKFKKISLSSVMYFVGSILGACLMFSNGAYSNVASGSDGYRSLQISNFITNSINSLINTIYKELVFQNYILNIVLSVCVVVFLYNYLKRENKYKNLINFFVLILISFPIYTLIIKFSGISLFLKYTDYVNTIFSIVYFLTVLCSSLLISDLSKKKRVIFALSSILILTIPLFVVTPIGSRCFFPMYILWIWVVLEFFDLALVDKDILVLKTILVGATLTFLCYLLLVYGYIFKINMERIEYINSNRDKECMYLPKLPYEDYHWFGNPYNLEFLSRFKAFYNIDKDVTVEFISIKEWKKIK